MDKTALTNQVKEQIGAFLKTDASHLQPQSRLATSFDGLDSMKQFEMAVYLEDCFEVEFNEADLDKLITLGDIVDYIEFQLTPKS